MQLIVTEIVCKRSHTLNKNFCQIEITKFIMVVEITSKIVTKISLFAMMHLIIQCKYAMKPCDGAVSKS